MIDYYSILKIPYSSSSQEIQQAFRKLAQKYHPDKNKGSKLAEKKFRQILRAYEALKNQKNREKIRKHYENKQVASRQELPLNVETRLSVNLQDIYLEKEFLLNYKIPFNGKNIKKELAITLPKHLKSGDKLKFLKKGGANGERLFGDLFIRVYIQTPGFFEIKKRDLHLQLSLSLYQAYKGGCFRIPGLKSGLQVKIPKKTLKNLQIKLPKEGLIKARTGSRGDMFIHIDIDYSKLGKRVIEKRMKILSEKDKLSLLKNQEYPKANLQEIQITRWEQAWES